VASRAEVKTLTSASLNAANDFAHPNAVFVRKATVVVRPPFVVILPKHSVTVITVMVQ
jgi:alpha-L-arabinofuranosidase